MEVQRGVVGDLATIPDLRDAVAAMELVPRLAELCAAARSAGAAVVHATAGWRADRGGTPLNTPIVRALARNPEQILEGTPAVDLVPELDGHDADLRSHRRHGMTPFPGTDLDAILRSRGVTTVVATGVSVNVGILGLCLVAADLGYRVVVPRDAVCGTPAEHVRSVFEHTLAPIATLCDTADLLAAWATP